MFLNFVEISDFSSYFNFNQQQDAHEFLQCFLNQLETCCYYLETKDNVVKEAFGGRFVSKVFSCFFFLFSLSFFSPIVLIFWTIL